MDNQANLELNYLVPVVLTDVNIVQVSEPDGIPQLLFAQVRKQEGSKLNADVVAAIRLSTIKDLENLRDSIDETIRQHNSKEK